MEPVSYTHLDVYKRQVEEKDVENAIIAIHDKFNLASASMRKN